MLEETRLILWLLQKKLIWINKVRRKKNLKRKKPRAEKMVQELPYELN
jgi:hypothetical protein